MVLLYCLLGPVAEAQCPNFLAIYQNVSQPLDPLIDDKGLELQRQQLTAWHNDWQQCRANPDSTFGLLLQRLGVVASWQGQTIHSIEWYKKAIGVFSKSRQDTRISSVPKANYLIGECYLLNNDYAKAKPVFEQILQLPEQPATISHKISSYLQLAYIQTNYGDYEKALKLLTSGVKIAEKYQNKKSLIQLNYQKSYILRRLERYKEAIDITHFIVRLAQKEQQTDELIKNYELLGTFYSADIQPDSALVFYTKALLLAQQTKRPIPNLIYNNIGYMYQLSKKPDDALKYYQKALQVETDRYDRAVVIDNIGSIEAQEKQYKKAFAHFQEAFNEVISDKPLKMSEENPKAITIKRSIRKQSLLLIIQNKADTWLEYYKDTKTKSHLTNALKTYALADSMIDFMRYEHAGEGSKLFWRQKTRAMYEKAIEACYLAGNTEQAFHFLEKSKAVLLADKVNELGANQQLSKVDTKSQRALRDSIDHLQNQLATLAPNDKKRTVLQSRLERFNDDFETFRKKLETTNPAYYRYKYDNSTPTINAFKKTIDVRSAFVSYFMGDSAIYAFKLTPQESKLVKLKISPRAYLSVTNEFLNLCANRAALNAHYPRYRALAYALYEQLWKPLNINAERVIVSQDGVFLPFEALLSQPDGSTFLLNKHAISYTYSANLLVKNQNPLRGGGGFVGFAPERFATSLQQVSLNGSAENLNEVKKHFWWAKNLTQANASKANFLQYAPNARVIQLFTHADANNTNATEPQIYFQDSALRLSEFSQTDRFKAELLVLSACKTGIGQNQRGEGVFSLARGFAALGIRSTVTTIWNVEDQPTYALTKLFYKYLHQNLPKDVALQKAKLDWIEAGGITDALPSQWAGMILVGDAAPLVSDNSPLILYGLGLLVLAILGGLWWRQSRVFVA